jgi:nucleoside-diphosphate-sugar epimerase
MTAEEPQTVLVTGGSGFVSSWMVAELLSRGYRVRTTVRSLAREPEVRAMISTHVDPGDRLSFHQADLLAAEGWKQAAAGATYVIHVASPMPVGEYRKQDVITPAREGTRHVLTAAIEAGVSRVVLTSSTAAAAPKQPGTLSDENTWTDVPDHPKYQYPRAKTLAEQDAWALIRQHGGSTELTTVLPANIQGPVLGRISSASIMLVAMMLRGKIPAVPRVGYNVVDVRDLVDLHLRAMTSPAAAGQRFLAAGDFLWLSQFAEVLRDELGEVAAKTPRRTLPDWVVRFGGLFNAEMAQLAPALGVRSRFDTSRTESVLGWNARPARTSVVDTARSLIAQKLL